MKDKKIKGFTLIELLIVIAIIAILAAIAIPNFLAAQVRAKVSHAKKGLQTVTTALESYYVDYNQYPPAYTAYTAESGPYAANNYQIPFELTTPIAYLSSIPKDPFDRYDTPNPVALRCLRYRKPGLGWRLQPDGSKNPVTVSMYVPDTFPIDGPGRWYYDEFRSPVRWGMWSVGPDGDFESETGVQPCRAISWYDPTNGIISNGNIVRFSTGLVVP